MTELRNVEGKRSTASAAGCWRLPGLCCLPLRCWRARLIYLQVLRHDELATQAEANRIAVVPVVPNRGQIVDRNGVVLATNYSAYTLESLAARRFAGKDGRRTGQRWSSSGRLVEIGPRDRRRFKRLREELKGADSLPIRTRLSDEEVARFTAQRFRFPGCRDQGAALPQLPAGRNRQPPAGLHRAHQPGRKKAMEDWDDDEQGNYKGTEYIGKLGLEQSYERQLHGKAGFEEVETSAGGRAVRRLNSHPPTAGRQAGAVHRHPAAGAGGRDVRRPARRAGGAWTRAPARCWPLSASPPSTPTCLSTASTRELARSEREHRQAAAQPSPARHLPARLHLQALHGHGRAQHRQTRTRHAHQRHPGLHLRQPPLWQPRNRAAWADGHEPRHRARAATSTSTRWPTRWAWT
jgi:hypothetical protein